MDDGVGADAVTKIKRGGVEKIGYQANWWRKYKEVHPGEIFSIWDDTDIQKIKTNKTGEVKTQLFQTKSDARRFIKSDVTSDDAICFGIRQQKQNMTEVGRRRDSWLIRGLRATMNPEESMSTSRNGDEKELLSFGTIFNQKNWPS